MNLRSSIACYFAAASKGCLFFLRTSMTSRCQEAIWVAKFRRLLCRFNWVEGSSAGRLLALQRTKHPAAEAAVVIFYTDVLVLVLNL